MSFSHQKASGENYSMSFCNQKASGENYSMSFCNQSMHEQFSSIHSLLQNEKLAIARAYSCHIHFFTLTRRTHYTQVLFWV